MRSTKRPGSALTQTSDKSALALYCGNTLPFHSTKRSYHTSHGAQARMFLVAATTLHFSLSLPPSISIKSTQNDVDTHTHTHREQMWEQMPHISGAVALCSNVRLQRDRGIRLTPNRDRSRFLSQHMPTVRTHAHIDTFFCLYCSVRSLYPHQIWKTQLRPREGSEHFLLLPVASPGFSQ